VVAGGAPGLASATSVVEVAVVAGGAPGLASATGRGGRGGRGGWQP
jgi:hypothetical protein